MSRPYNPAYEPEGFTEGDRAKAFASRLYDAGPRRTVHVVLDVAISVPIRFGDDDAAVSVEWILEEDPYVLSVKEVGSDA